MDWRDEIEEIKKELEVLTHVLTDTLTDIFKKFHTSVSLLEIKLENIENGANNEQQYTKH